MSSAGSHRHQHQQRGHATGQGSGRGRGGGSGGRWQRVPGPAGSPGGSRGVGDRGPQQHRDPSAAATTPGSHEGAPSPAVTPPPSEPAHVAVTPEEEQQRLSRRKRSRKKRNNSVGKQQQQQQQQRGAKEGAAVSLASQGKWSDEDDDDDEKQAHGRRVKHVQRRNEKGEVRGALVNPLVHCLDERGQMSLVTLHDLLLQGTDDIDHEADTPLIAPQAEDPDAPSNLSLTRMPPLPPAVVVEPARGQRERPLMPPPGAFKHDSITTPNTLRAIAAPSAQPRRPLVKAVAHKCFYRSLLYDFSPIPDVEDGSCCFGWAESAETKSAFVDKVTEMCAELGEVLKLESMMRTIEAPAYVFGDIHGNFVDLAFFLKSVLVFGDIHLSPCHILCLGDYVDRGPHSLECVVLLFALKLECPEKVTLLRGNHEDRVVCGDRHTYGSESFLSQCQTNLGAAQGMRLFLAVTKVFTYLPLAAEIVVRVPRPSHHHQHLQQQQPQHQRTGTTTERRILCTHGGIPRFFGNPMDDDMIAFLRSEKFPRLLTLFPNNPLARQHPEDLVPHIECDDQTMQKAWYAMFDLMWSDPTPHEVMSDDGASSISTSSTDNATAAASSGSSPAVAHVNEWGFGVNSRGSNVVTFSAKAVDTFLAAHNFAMLFRAHQEKAHGIRLSKSQKVLTIFSSSNYLGHGNGAGCVVVSRDGEVQLIVKTSDSR